MIVERRDAPGNLFLSPLSVAMALAMTYNGAAGTTEEAMRATLGLDGMTVFKRTRVIASLSRCSGPWTRGSDSRSPIRSGTVRIWRSSSRSSTPRLTPGRWEGWIAGLDSASSQVYFPKYVLTDDLLLNSTLDALGMGIAFDCDVPEVADFTRMHLPQEVCITRVKHKTDVYLNEAGTEAAAVTAVEVGVTSAPPTISVDRPFPFAIRETVSGTIFFSGVIRNPIAA